MTFHAAPHATPDDEAADPGDLIAGAVAFLDEATPGASRLRGPLRIEVVRPLDEPDITGGFLAPAPPPTLRDIKSSHHTLARLLAQGRSHVEASRITGYSPGYVGRLANDPTFRELVLHYTEVDEIAQTDFLGTMREVGLDLLNELRDRVEKDPGALSVSQLHDGIKLLLVEPMKSEAMRGGLAAGIAPVTIQFIASATPQAGAEREARVIEHTPGAAE